MRRVLVIAPSSVVRAGLEAIVRDGPDLEVVGAVASFTDLEDQLEDVAPDAVVAAFEGTAEIAAMVQREGIPPLVLLTADPTDAALAALRHGGRAVLPRDALPEEIVAAIEAAIAGLVVLHIDTAVPLLPHVQGLARSEPNTAIEHLTPREIEVLTLLAEGAGNKTIARRMGISEHTVKFHVGSIMAKLDASSRTEAVTLGLRQGLILL